VCVWGGGGRGGPRTATFSILSSERGGSPCAAAAAAAASPAPSDCCESAGRIEPRLHGMAASGRLHFPPQCLRGRVCNHSFPYLPNPPLPLLPLPSSTAASPAFFIRHNFFCLPLPLQPSASTPGLRAGAGCGRGREVGGLAHLHDLLVDLGGVAALAVGVLVGKDLQQTHPEGVDVHLPPTRPRRRSRTPETATWSRRARGRRGLIWQGGKEGSTRLVCW
jgi:hypothetical protein